MVAADPAPFLHYGAFHLAMNMLGLWFLGPPAEFALGFRRFVAIYLLAGIGSMATVLACGYGADEAPLTVGASGCVMGLVGALGALMLRGWLHEKAHAAKRRLLAVLLIVLLQSVFDVAVPQVSMTAHLFGACIGFLATMVFAAGRQHKHPCGRTELHRQKPGRLPHGLAHQPRNEFAADRGVSPGTSCASRPFPVCGVAAIWRATETKCSLSPFE